MSSTMTTQTKIIAVLTARPGQAEALEALLRDIQASSRAEPGNLLYDLWRDPAEPGRFILDELYADGDAVAAHRASPHFQTYMSRINDLADRVAWTLDPVSVA